MANFLSVLLGHFIKHKPLFYEKWDGKRRKIFICMIWKKNFFEQTISKREWSYSEKDKTCIFKIFFYVNWLLLQQILFSRYFWNWRFSNIFLRNNKYVVLCVQCGHAVSLLKYVSIGNWNFLQIFLSKYFIHDAIHVCALKTGGKICELKI